MGNVRGQDLEVLEFLRLLRICAPDSGADQTGGNDRHQAPGASHHGEPTVHAQEPREPAGGRLEKVEPQKVESRVTQRL